MGSGSVFVFGNCHPHCLNYSFTTWRVGRPGVAWVLALLLIERREKTQNVKFLAQKPGMLRLFMVRKVK
jgi:hypothetical protein